MQVRGQCTCSRLARSYKLLERSVTYMVLKQETALPREVCSRVDMHDSDELYAVGMLMTALPVSQSSNCCSCCDG